MLILHIIVKIRCFEHAYFHHFVKIKQKHPFLISYFANKVRIT